MNNELIEAAQKRIATCDIYINQRALVSHNFVVVSSMCNGRGVYCIGNEQVVVGMFPASMPTCFTREDAETLVREVKPSNETLRVISAREWWTNERAESQAIIDLINSKTI